MELSPGFQVRFDQLPLEIKAQNLFKIWKQGTLHKIIHIKKEELYFLNKHLFLFGQYGRFKKINQPLVS